MVPENVHGYIPQLWMVFTKASTEPPMLS